MPKPLLPLIALALILAGLAHIYWPRAITEEALARQLAGQHCRFAYEVTVCAQRGLEPVRRLFTEGHDCDMWAVQCLATFTSPQAARIMMDVLARKTDVQTCDGVWPIRSAAVKYLGASGYRAALPALRAHLASAPTATLSAGASGCVAGPENLDIVRAAIGRLEGS